jgi:hypothetical protein
MMTRRIRYTCAAGQKYSKHRLGAAEPAPARAVSVSFNAPKASLYSRLGSIPLEQVRAIILRHRTFFNDWVNVIASDMIAIAVAIYLTRCHKFFF